MFGNVERPEMPKLVPREVPKKIDCAGAKANEFGHYGRQPNTNYKYRMMRYEQHQNDITQRKLKTMKKILEHDHIDAKYTKHTAKRRLSVEVKARLEAKMNAYESSFEERRSRLRELLWKEEREYLKEVIEQAQQGDDWRLQQMKIRLQELRANKEAERVKLAEEKKMQQYIVECDEFRPILSKQRLVDSKNAQLEQIKQNENKRANEREQNVMWHQITMQGVEKQNERAHRDEMARQKRNAESRAMWDMQIKARELSKENEVREKQEDRIHMDKLKEQAIKEELAELEVKRRKRQEVFTSLRSQIKDQEEVLKRRTEEERDFERLYNGLVDEELKQAVSKLSGKTACARQEMAQYREYLAQLKEDREEEEKRLDALVKKTMDGIIAKQDETKCKLKWAQAALQKSVLEGLGDQVKHRREEAELQLKMKEAENQMMQITFEQNGRARVEQARQEMLAAKEYGEDLKQQAEYNKLLKEREFEVIEKRLAQSKIDEENCRKTLLRLITGEVDTHMDHPFKRAFNKKTCFCPNK